MHSFKISCTHAAEVDIVLFSAFELAGDLAEDGVATPPSSNEPRAAAHPDLMLIIYTHDTVHLLNLLTA